MRMSSLLTPGLLLAMLTLSCGCGKTAAPPTGDAAAEAKPAEAQPANNQELNQAIQQPLDKARAVEGKIAEDAAKTDEAIDAQSD